jgi:hypothetical protein
MRLCSDTLSNGDEDAWGKPERSVELVSTYLTVTPELAPTRDTTLGMKQSKTSKLALMPMTVDAPHECQRKRLVCKAEVLRACPIYQRFDLARNIVRFITPVSTRHLNHT